MGWLGFLGLYRDENKSHYSNNLPGERKHTHEFT